MRFIIYFIFFMILLGFLAVVGGIYYLIPSLPDTDTLQDAQFQVPLRVYSREGSLISEFGEKRRRPVVYEEVPVRLVKAFLASEDDRFFEHPGVDWQGIVRATIQLIQTGERSQGGSTITMQVARNFFLTPEKTYTRKLKEILLALKIERELTKDEILELYLNKIYLGHRSYGIVAASDLYYGSPLSDLTLPQAAMLAGLPKAPSTLNPITNPERAIKRRNYVLRRMRSLGMISPEEYQKAKESPVTARIHRRVTDVSSPYIAEMVRSFMVNQYGKEAYTTGFRVYTTISDHLQRAADQALRNGLLNYDKRHGYRGAEHHLDLSDQHQPNGDAGSGEHWANLLEGFPIVGGLVPGLVISVANKSAEVYVRDIGTIMLDWKGLSWAKPYIDENRQGGSPASADQILNVGDVIRLLEKDDEKNVKSWRLSQIPDVEGALVSLSPENGAIRALSGGFDFNRSKFNRVIQAYRQPGSSFKPFIYSAALENGYTAASLVNDAPVVFDDPSLEDTWRPENYSGKYYGPTRLRDALTHSRNLVSIRLMRSMGIKTALEHLKKFAFDIDRLPHDLSLSLGSGTITPLSLATGYAVLANGGYKIEPYFIERIETISGEILFEAKPKQACRDCTAASLEADKGDYAPQVLDPANAYIVSSMMQDVIRAGTGRRALVLKRSDLSGKTGTTNDQKDAWFSGFNARVVTTAWVGFDQLRPLGSRETGGFAALPMWIDYMKVALKEMPESPPITPENIDMAEIDPDTGKLVQPGSKGVMEVFRSDNLPTQMSNGTDPETGETNIGIPEQLF